MPASVDYNIVGASAPFTFSVKDENGIERFLNIGGGKIYFTAPTNGKYLITISKGNCHIKNETIITNCSVPVVVSCVAPFITLTSVLDLTTTFSISSGTSCSSYEVQYSLDDLFSQYTSKFISCVNSTSLTFPAEDLYYVRLVKYCGQLKSYSNVISVNLKSANCFISASCQGIGNDPDYDTFRIALSKPASENIEFYLSNSSIIVINQGQSVGQEIINISNGCPYIVSNSVNLKYCGILTPISQTTPTSPSPVSISNCIKISALNSSGFSDIITFTLCNGEEQSYTLNSNELSPEVCVINENAWVSNLGEITIYKHGNC